MAGEGEGRRLLPRSPPPWDFVGVVTREAGRLRPRPPPPPSAPRPKVAGEVGGAAAGCADPGVNLPPPSPHVLKQMSPIDGLGGRSSRPPPARGRPPRRAGEGAGLRPREGRGVGSQPGNRAPGQRGSSRPPSRPWGGEAGAHGPSRAWAAPSWLGWGWSWLPGTPREVRALALRAARVCALTLWVSSLVSSRPCPRGAALSPGLLHEAQGLHLDEERPQ